MKDNDTISKGFKMTKLGLLSEEWKVVRLGDVADYINGYAFKPSDWSPEGKPIIRIQNLNDKTKPYNFYRKALSNKFLVRKEDLLISWSASLGAFLWKGEDAWLNQHIFKVVLRQEVASKKFIYFLTNHIIHRLKAKTRGSTMKHIVKKEFLNLEIPFPPLPEQKKIAAVLSTVQEAKEKAEVVIEAAREVKKSLMKYLFTYGSMPTEEAENVRLEETEIGLLPEEWEVMKLGDVAGLIMGQSPPGSTYNERGQGMPFLQGKAEFGATSPKHVKYTTKPLKIAPKGSVLVSVRAPVGDVNIAGIDYCIGRGLASLSLSEGGNSFLFFLLNYFKNKLKKEGTGSTFKAINKSKLQEFKIPFPPLHIQQEITEILSNIDEKIEAEKNKKKALEELFKTLLNNLMIAKIRVNHLEIAV